MDASNTKTNIRQYRHECEEFHNFNGEMDCQKKFNECKKNPQHDNFFPVCELQMKDLPPELQTDKCMRYINDRCNRTVRVHVLYTSPHRPDTYPRSEIPYPGIELRDNGIVDRCGTGFIIGVQMRKDDQCPCEKCENSGQLTEYMKVTVSTARHVVFDRLEADKTLFECFYDTEDRSEVKMLYGVDARLRIYQELDDDVVIVDCVTHDRDLMNKLTNVIDSVDSVLRYYHDGCPLDTGFTVSHPHGEHKFISFGIGRFRIYHIIRNQLPDTQRPGFVKCRLNRQYTNNAQCSQDRVNEIYLDNEVISPSMFEPGNYYLLRETSLLCIPSYPEPPHYWGKRTHDGWLELPKGGGYMEHLHYGNFVPFPQGMQIDAEIDYDKYTYTIPTCPGSSGAGINIFKGNGGDRFTTYVHSGGSHALGNIGELFRTNTNVQYGSQDHTDFNVESESTEPLSISRLNLRFSTCKKNPGHEKFLPVCELRMENVPPEFQTDRRISIIKNMCTRTVRVRVAFISPDRPDTYPGSDLPYPFSIFKGRPIVRCGTGVIFEMNLYKDDPCPCKICKNSGPPVTGYAKVQVHTSLHTIYDKVEAKETVFECFFDSPDRDEVKLLYGIDVGLRTSQGIHGDVNVVYCVTHENDLMDKLRNAIKPPDFPSINPSLHQGFIVSHPHGVRKHISFGHSRLSVYNIYPSASKKHPGFVKCRLNRPTCANKAPISHGQEVGKHKDYNIIMMYLDSATPAMEPGIDYLLADTSMICMPSTHEVIQLFRHIFYQVDNYIDDDDRDDDWFKLPEGSGFIDSEGKLVKFTPGMETNARLNNITHTYTIPTCPGCSGAAVTFYYNIDNCDDYVMAFVHTDGGDDDNNEENEGRTIGLSRVWKQLNHGQLDSVTGLEADKCAHDIRPVSVAASDSL